MKIETLFEFIRSKWPAQIDISDAEVNGRGFGCSNLIRLEEEVSSTLDDADVSYAAAWAFHQALAGYARGQYGAGVAVIDVNQVLFRDFAKYLCFNLSDPSWSEVWEAFKKDNPGLQDLVALESGASDPTLP